MIPKNIKVGPYRYTVECLTPVLAENNERLSGQARHTEQRILVDSDAAPPYQFETFIHEALHAMAIVADVRLKEVEVSRLSMVLTAFLIDNGFTPAEGEQAA